MNVSNKAILALLIGFFFWSINAAVARVFTDEINYMTLSIVRWSIAAVFITMFNYGHYKRSFNFLKKHPIQVSLLSLLAVTLFNTLLYKASITTQNININLINTLIAPVTVLFAIIFSKKKITLINGTGLLFAFIGTLVIISKASIENILNLSFVSGDLYMLIAVFVWGFYSIFLSKFKPTISQLELLFLMIWLGLIFLIILSFFIGIDLSNYKFKLNHLYVYLYVGIFPSIVSVFCYNYAVMQIGARKSAFGTYLFTIYGILIGTIVLNESLHLYHLFGTGAVFLGMYLNYSKRFNAYTSN